MKLTNAQIVFLVRLLCFTVVCVIVFVLTMFLISSLLFTHSKGKSSHWLAVATVSRRCATVVTAMIARIAILLPSLNVRTKLLCADSDVAPIPRFAIVSGSCDSLGQLFCRPHLLTRKSQPKAAN